MAEKRSRGRKTPEKDAVEHILQGKDKAFLEGRFINNYKGRGVFTREHIQPKSFVVEYRGVLLQSIGTHEENGKYILDFMWNGKQHCIDASKEDQTLGRLVNDDHVHPNCKVKRLMVQGRPHLCLFAVKDIFPGEEITYNYGDSSWPWRSVAPCEEQSDLHVNENEPTPEKEALGGSDAERPVVSPSPETSKDDTCHHRMVSAVLSALDNCQDCSGPVSSLKWLGYTCKLCSRSWHKFCFLKKNSSLDVTRASGHVSGSENSDGASDDGYLPSVISDGLNSDEDFVPETELSNDSEDAQSVILPLLGPGKSTSPLGKTKGVLQRISCKSDLIHHQPCSDDGLTPSHNPTDAAESFTTSASQPGSSCTVKNYCFICKKPQSKISRHFEKHKKEDHDIAQAFSFPKNSKERRMLLEKLRNKGNYEHNKEVMNNHGGALKVKRRTGPSKVSLDAKLYVHCTYCKGMFVRKDLWRHTRRCSSRTKTEFSDKSKVLSLADIAESACSQAISSGVWKVLGKMRQDDIGSVVQNDFLILQLAQSLYNKHGSDPTKFEYIRTEVREIGRLLLTLRERYSILTFEDALKPNNFYKIVSAVKTVAGYNEDKHSYSTPSLALKLGHSLKKIGDIIICRAIAAEDENLIRAVERFTKLCSKEWAGQVSHTALATLSKSKYNKPSIIPFTEDVQKLHKYLEEKSASAIDNLKDHESPQAYGELAKVTLTQIILFNRRRAGEVSKMTLESFQKRDQTELHSDVAASLSPFEQKLARHFSRVEIMGKRGRKVAVLLNPEVVGATTLLVERREICNVHKDNPFLFGRPECPSTSHFRGQDCVRTFAHLCGAKNPQNLRSTQLRKHIATQSQILNLQNNELDQLANFLGHDIRVHRHFYRLPEATIEVAKITKILLAMEKGTLAEFQGKSLDEIEIEDELGLEMDEGEQDDEDNKNDEDDKSSSEDDLDREGEGGSDSRANGEEDEDGGNGEADGSVKLRENQEMTMDEEPTNSSGKRKRMVSTKDEVTRTKGQKKKCENITDVTSSKEVKSRKCVKRPWSKTETSAVMKHFKAHIQNGKLATTLECQQCKVAEHPVLKDRSLQNIRDFVRNRGLKFRE